MSLHRQLVTLLRKGWDIQATDHLVCDALRERADDLPSLPPNRYILVGIKPDGTVVLAGYADIDQRLVVQTNIALLSAFRDAGVGEFPGDDLASVEKIIDWAHQQIAKFTEGD